jgi:hypothetical protein
MNVRVRGRQGTILIIVAAMSALLASMALTFLVRMRSDVEESRLVMQETQAQIMLTAACNFIMEKSRLGWNPAPPPGLAHSPIHREAFGWVDVRNGQPGPRDETGEIIGTPNTTDPMGENVPDSWVDLALPPNDRPARREPMFVMIRPPYAVMPTVATNPVELTGTNGLKPVLVNPDPTPVAASGMLEDYARGDKRPDPGRKASAWFRVWRAGPAIFVVTAGAGDTLGFRDWNEVRREGETDSFGGDTEAGRSMFHFLQSQEVRKWYLVEWSPYVASSDYQNIQNEWSFKDPGVETYLQRPMNTSQESRSQGRVVNPVGTIRSIRRLMNEPDHW